MTHSELCQLVLKHEARIVALEPKPSAVSETGEKIPLEAPFIPEHERGTRQTPQGRGPVGTEPANAKKEEKKGGHVL